MEIVVKIVTFALIAKGLLLNNDEKKTTMKRLLSLIFLLCAVSTLYGQSRVPAELKNTTQEDWDVLRLTNNERMRAGLPIFVTTEWMQYFSAVRAQELLSYYNHNRPTGKAYYSIFDENNFTNSTSAENIAMGYTSPAAAVEGWMNSSGHRANIMNRDLRYLSTGMRDNGTKYWVQLFATNSGSEATGVVFDKASNSFIFTLANGSKAYAPYDAQTFARSGSGVIVNYPGISGVVSVSGAATSGGETTAPPVTSNDNYDEPSNDSDNVGGTFVIKGKHLAFDGRGEAILIESDAEHLIIEPMSDYTVAIRSADGRYLSHNNAIFANSKVLLSDQKYVWAIFFEEEGGLSLRCSEDLGMILGVNDKGKLVVLDHGSLDIGDNMKFMLFF